MKQYEAFRSLLPLSLIVRYATPDSYFMEFVSIFICIEKLEAFSLGGLKVRKRYRLFSKLCSCFRLMRMTLTRRGPPT